MANVSSFLFLWGSQIHNSELSPAELSSQNTSSSMLHAQWFNHQRTGCALAYTKVFSILFCGFMHIKTYLLLGADFVLLSILQINTGLHIQQSLPRAPARRRPARPLLDLENEPQRCSILTFYHLISRRTPGILVMYWETYRTKPGRCDLPALAPSGSSSTSRLGDFVSPGDFLPGIGLDNGTERSWAGIRPRCRVDAMWVCMSAGQGQSCPGPVSPWPRQRTSNITKYRHKLTSIRIGSFRFFFPEYVL